MKKVEFVVKRHFGDKIYFTDTFEISEIDWYKEAQKKMLAYDILEYNVIGFIVDGVEQCLKK